MQLACATAIIRESGSTGAESACLRRPLRKDCRPSVSRRRRYGVIPWPSHCNQWLRTSGGGLPHLRTSDEVTPNPTRHQTRQSSTNADQWTSPRRLSATATAGLIWIAGCAGVKVAGGAGGSSGSTPGSSPGGSPTFAQLPRRAARPTHQLRTARRWFPLIGLRARTAAAAYPFAARSHARSSNGT